MWPCTSGWRYTSNYQLEDFDGATLGKTIWVAEDGNIGKEDYYLVHSPSR
ncbi:hypothetical protein [Serratia marcescens]|nr:hypothetical protein [Serratia marcescens]